MMFITIARPAGRPAGRTRLRRAISRTLVFIFAVAFAVAFAPRPAAAGVRISEFLADNAGGLRDAEGESPDWIEIHNDSPTGVNLLGWHLTDSSDQPAKWTFPSVTVPAGSFIVVFASGKNRATAGAELHTNFELDEGGEYLALVQPDGTIVQQFAPAFPPQRQNVSFGAEIQTTTTPLVQSGANSRVLIPGDALVDEAWMLLGFDDSAWTMASTGVGFGGSGSGGSVVLAIDFNDDDMGEAGSANSEPGFSSMALSSNPATFNGITVTVSAIGGATLDDRDRAVPTPTATLTQDQLYDDFIFAVGQTNGNGLSIQMTGLAPNQDFFVRIWSYDNSSAGGRVSDWVESASGVTRVITNGYTFDGVVVPIQDGQHTLGGTVRSSPTGTLLIEGRRAGGTSHGVFLNALELSQAVTDLGTAMTNVNATAYLRIPFTVTDPTAIETLNLRMKYDDGFIAYLNGQVVASRNAPATPAWNSTATAPHPNAEAVIFEEFSFAASLGLLVAGQNVLAIHGLNVSPGDSDFLILPELTGLATSENAGLYLKPPTPGSVNSAGYPGFVADTKFSVDRGFYDAPISVALTTATEGATIRWTTNGSAPTETSGTIYSAPIGLSGTTLLRAAAFKPGLLPSDVDTHTYIYLAQVRNQPATLAGYPTVWQGAYPADYGMDPVVANHGVYGPILSNALRSIPTLSIVSDHQGLWNASTGIYPNATSSGAAWERAASLELIDGSGQTEFAVNCKVEMHGNASRDNVRTPKHSIRATFDADYGPARLRYDWFRGPGATEHNKIILRSCGFVDGWAGRYADTGTYVSSETGETFRGLRYRPENTCYLRDSWVKDSFRDMGWLSSRSQYVHLYLNGLYWGLYEPSEAIEASYFAETVGGLESSWDVIVGEDNNGPPVLVDGSLADWQDVLNRANAGVTSEAAYQAIAQRVDIDNLIDYMIVHIFAESEDWPRHNWYVAHRRATNGVPGTKFICMVWDQELTLDRLVRRNRVEVGTSGGEIYSPGRVYAALRAWPEFRRQFGDRVHHHLFNNGALTPSNNIGRLLASAAIIRDAVVGESARWGDAREFTIGGNTGTGQTFTRNEWWQPEIDKLATNFLQKLTADNVARFRTGNLYPTLHAPILTPFGGAMAAGATVTLSNPNPAGVVYFTTDGTDPRTYGTSAVSPTAQAYSGPIAINATTQIRARTLNGGVWSALVNAVYYPPQDLSRLSLTEVMFHPPGSGLLDGDEFEFIELKNTGTNQLNLSGLTFSDGINFTFTNGTLLDPGAFFVLARNPSAFAQKYPGVNVQGVFSGRLDNGGERISLSHPLGSGIFSVNYDDGVPWPITADNYGFSIVQRNPLTQAPDSGAAWRASANPGGSPGADDPSSAIPSIVINEVLTASTPPDFDRIELFNPTSQAVGISGWLLSDDPSVPFKYRIPDGTVIAAGSLVVFTEQQFNATPGAPGNFSLSSRGEGVYLFSTDGSTNLTGYTHGFVFDAADPGVSFGRHVNSVGDETFPSQTVNSFGLPNAGPRVGPVVIREIHYNPAPGGDEFLELANITTASVSLFDPARPTNTWRLNGVGFEFPTNVTLGAQAVALLVATNPASFRAKYQVPESVLILGPYSGELQDSGERLRLERPAVSEETNSLVYIVVDDIRYNDKAPWMPAADGSGASLQRIVASDFGNDPANWRAGVPSPGGEYVNGDADNDGLPDDWEIAHGTNPSFGDADEDPDSDGLTNAEEYAAGTHPNQSASTLRVDDVQADGTQVALTFQRAADRPYRVLYKDSLADAQWLKLTDVPASGTAGPVTVMDTAPSFRRFYRIVTP